MVPRGARNELAIQLTAAKPRSMNVLQQVGPSCVSEDSQVTPRHIHTHTHTHTHTWSLPSRNQQPTHWLYRPSNRGGAGVGVMATGRERAARLAVQTTREQNVPLLFGGK